MLDNGVTQRDSGERASQAEAAMIGRRDWMGREITRALAAWGACQAAPFLHQARGQTGPAGKASASSRTVRRPALPKNRSTTPGAPGSATPALQQDPQLAHLLEQIRDAQHLPGIIGAIVRGDRLTNIAAAGVRKLGSAQPMKIDDQVHLGSCTKAMTATLCGMLVDDGLLEWSSTVHAVFPEVASQLHPDFQAVTLAQLLTHRAGLPHDASWWRLPGQTTTDQRRAALLELLCKPPLSRPGTVYAYSNAGYVLAGLMAEQVSGQPWEDLMQDRLFEPLGMSSAGFGPPGGAARGRIEQPWGHRETGGKLVPVLRDNAPCMGPAGTVHCSVPDWGKFASLHLRGAQGKGRLLKPATFRTLHTPPPGFDYAGGWTVGQRPWSGGKILSHNGSNTYWYASIWIVPARDFLVMAVTNQAGPNAEAACQTAIDQLTRVVDLRRPRSTRR